MTDKFNGSKYSKEIGALLELKYKIQCEGDQDILDEGKFMAYYHVIDMINDKIEWYGKLP